MNRSLKLIAFTFLLTACSQNLLELPKSSSPFRAKEFTAIEESKGFELEVNVGPIPFESIDSLNGKILPSCVPTKTVRACLQDMFAQYAQQGVKGIRFMFDLNASGYPFEDSGLPSDAWLEKVGRVFADMKAAGISRMTPTPNWWGWGNEVERSVVDPCTGKTTKFKFFKATPYAFEAANGYPYNVVGNRSYECSPANPVFVGWTHIYGLFDGLLARAKASGMEVSQFDIQNEINVFWFPVMARLILDNKHGDTGDTHVLNAIRGLMKKNGFNPESVTYSVPASNTSEANFDCTSAYGESARIVNLSALASAIEGKPFGQPSNFEVSNKLVCGGTLEAGARLATSQPLPGVFDAHAYNCVETENGTCDPLKGEDIESDSNVFYNGVQDFLDSRGKTFARFMLGETHSLLFRNGQECEGIHIPTDAGRQITRAVLSSRLVRSPGRNKLATVVRPWNYIMDASGCFQMKHPVNPPYDEKTPTQLPNPILSVTLSHAHGAVDETTGSAFAILKGNDFDLNGNNRIESNCAGVEKVYDGVDGAGFPMVRQINVRVPARSQTFTCEFTVIRPDGQSSDTIVLALPPIHMNPPTVQAVGGTCDHATINGSGFYMNTTEVHVRKADWSYILQVSGISTPSAQTLGFQVPANVQDLFRTEGLRFTVLNSETGTWTTSEVAKCK